MSRDLVNVADVGVIQCRRRLGLLEEALFGRLVSRQVRREELDRDVPIQPRVMGQVDDAHAPAPKLGDDRIRAEGRAGGEGHGRGRFYLWTRSGWPTNERTGWTLEGQDDRSGETWPMAPTISVVN